MKRWSDESCDTHANAAQPCRPTPVEQWRARSAVALVALVACSHADLATVRDASDLSDHDQARVELVGTYAVEDMGRYRVTTTMADGRKVTSNMMVSLVLEDGAIVRIGARPDEERARLTGRTVIARGRLLSDPPRSPPDVASPLPAPTLVDVETIAVHEVDPND